VYLLVVLLIVGGMLGLSYLLGERQSERATGQTYESGAPSTGTGRSRFSVQFYLLAMFFVIFDLEIVYLVAWSVAAREVGWTGYVEILIFSFVLTVALVYLWRAGGLDWGPERLTASDPAEQRNREGGR
jgi:NADH-quinone oxidoreductase subunit A